MMAAGRCKLAPKLSRVRVTGGAGRARDADSRLREGLVPDPRRVSRAPIEPSPGILNAGLERGVPVGVGLLELLAAEHGAEPGVTGIAIETDQGLMVAALAARASRSMSLHVSYRASSGPWPPPRRGGQGPEGPSLVLLVGHLAAHLRGAAAGLGAGAHLVVVEPVALGGAPLTKVGAESAQFLVGLAAAA